MSCLMKMQSSPSQAGVYIAEGPPQADFFRFLVRNRWNTFKIHRIWIIIEKISACGGQNHYKIEHPAHLD